MFTLNCRGRLMVIDQPIVMGIINATPDSFYSGSRRESVEEALVQAERMLREGAMILDIGGQSTRPGMELAGEEVELKRILPVVESIKKQFPEAFLSIDTFHSNVAKSAIHAGADIVNDISGGSFDSGMLASVADLKVPYVCMHANDRFDNMHVPRPTTNIIQDILDYFIQKLDACKNAGILDVIIDPGFGFSKTIPNNFSIIQQLEILKILYRPILLGVSRKSSIYKTLGITPEESLNGTTVLNTIGLMKGASILRVHDVKEAVEAIKLFSEVQK